MLKLHIISNRGPSTIATWESSVILSPWVEFDGGENRILKPNKREFLPLWCALQHWSNFVTVKDTSYWNYPGGPLTQQWV